MKTLTFHFETTDELWSKYLKWSLEQDELVYQQQILLDNQVGENARRDGHAYYGACGGSNIYEYSTTTLGSILKVRHPLTNNVFDLTDYKSW